MKVLKEGLEKITANDISTELTDKLKGEEFNSYSWRFKAEKVLKEYLLKNGGLPQMVDTIYLENVGGHSYDVEILLTVNNGKGRGYHKALLGYLTPRRKKGQTHSYILGSYTDYSIESIACRLTADDMLKAIVNASNQLSDQQHKYDTDRKNAIEIFKYVADKYCNGNEMAAEDLFKYIRNNFYSIRNEIEEQNNK